MSVEATVKGSLYFKNKKMTKEEAISVLLQVAEVAQSKGILNLKDATIVYQATVVLTEKEVEPMPMPMVDPEKVIKTEPRK